MKKFIDGIPTKTPNLKGNYGLFFNFTDSYITDSYILHDSFSIDLILTYTYTYTVSLQLSAQNDNAWETFYKS